MTAPQWYYGRGTDITGPVSSQNLSDLVTSGEVLRTDTVWQDGVEMGVPAGQVKGLFPSAPRLAAADTGPAAAVAPEPPPPVLPPTELKPLPRLEAATGSPAQAPALLPMDSAAAPTSDPTAASDGRPILPVAPEDAKLVVLDEPEPAPAETAPQAAPPRKARAVAGRGAVIVGQDGTNVKFRLKCTTCGHEDSSWKTMRITRGTMRSSFYCPKCRKKRDGELNGVV